MGLVWVRSSLVSELSWVRIAQKQLIWVRKIHSTQFGGQGKLAEFWFSSSKRNLKPEYELRIAKVVIEEKCGPGSILSCRNPTEVGVFECLQLFLPDDWSDRAEELKKLPVWTLKLFWCDAPIFPNCCSLVFWCGTFLCAENAFEQFFGSVCATTKS